MLKCSGWDGPPVINDYEAVCTNIHTKLNICIQMTEVISFRKTGGFATAVQNFERVRKKCLNSSHTKLISSPSCWALGTLGAEVVTSQGTRLMPADSSNGGEVDIGALGGVCEGTLLPWS